MVQSPLRRRTSSSGPWLMSDWEEVCNSRKNLPRPAAPSALGGGGVVSCGWGVVGPSCVDNEDSSAVTWSMARFFEGGVYLSSTAWPCHTQKGNTEAKEDREVPNVSCGC